MISVVINLIQIQHLLKLNNEKNIKRGYLEKIQIQHLLKLNWSKALDRLSQVHIQIQHLLKLNKIICWRL